MKVNEGEGDGDEKLWKMEEEKKEDELKSKMRQE